MPGDTKGVEDYAAFISYSHADEELADWLHKRLESFRTPKGLAERGTGAPLRDRLGRVFRDRAELSAAHDLAQEIRSALDVSTALIVLCSPRAAGSAYVNDEIRYFKSLGRGDQVFVGIVAGEPHASRLDGIDDSIECFPEALIYSLDDSGNVSDLLEPVEPIAADFREGKDGRENGALKIIAGLLGVRLDDLIQREKMAERRRRRQAYGVALATSALALAAVAGAIFAFVQQRQADQRRVEVVANQARNFINDGERDAATAFLARQNVRAKLLKTGLGRWVVAQTENTRWSRVWNASEALLDCGDRSVLSQNGEGKVRVWSAPGGELTFKARDTLIACFGSANAIEMFDVQGNAYSLAAGASDVLVHPAQALLPHTIVQAPDGDVILDSQVSGLYEFKHSTRRFVRLGKAGPSEDQRLQIFAGPVAGIFFSIRQSGRGRFFAPSPIDNDRSASLKLLEARATAQNSLIDTRGFLQCASAARAEKLLCVVDGGVAFLSWEGALSPVLLPAGARPASVVNLGPDSERFGIIDDVGDVWIIAASDGALIATISAIGGEAPIFLHAFAGDQGIVWVSASGHLCVLAVVSPECLLRDRVALTDGAVTVAYRVKDQTLWVQGGDRTLMRAPLSPLTMSEAAQPGGGERGNAAKPERRSPQKSILKGHAVGVEEQFGGALKFGEAPRLSFLSADLTWRLQYGASGLQLVENSQAFDLSAKDSLLEVKEGRNFVWLRFADRVERVDLSSLSLGVVGRAVFKISGEKLFSADNGELVLLQSPERTWVISADHAYAGTAKMALTESPNLITLEPRRGLVSVWSGDCRNRLFDLDYADPVQTSLAPCIGFDRAIIDRNVVSLSKNSHRLISPLPRIYVNP